MVIVLKLICFPSEKGSSLKKKFGSKFFPFRVDLCGPCCLVERRVDPNRSGHMWESQVLLTDGQVVFPQVLQFSPTFGEQSAQYK